MGKIFEQELLEHIHMLRHAHGEGDNELETVNTYMHCLFFIITYDIAPNAVTLIFTETLRDSKLAPCFILWLIALCRNP
jgi:hypothetical protein